MLLRHSLAYTLARGVPGIINFLALAVYTRLLAPQQYGYYALVLAVVSLVNVVLWQWLRLGLLRFLASHEDQRQAFLSTVAAAFLLLLLASACVFALVIVFYSNQYWIGFAALALVLLWAQAWFELNLELARSSLSPLLYGGLASVKSVTAILCGSGLAYWGFGAKGVLMGLLIGFALPALWTGCRVWRVVRFRFADRQILTQLAHYGLPLTATFAMGFVVTSSDRLLIGWLMDSEATGLYAVGYDLAAQTLGMLMSIINLAAYPLVVRKLEQEGEAAARQQLRATAALLLTAALPVTVAWTVLVPNVAAVLLDAAYVDTAIHLVPIVASAALIAGVQHFYFDLAFQLGKRTSAQIWVMLIAATVNVVLNLWWIPRFGLQGAAYATLAAYVAGLLCSWWLGRRVFALPMPSHVPGIVAAVAVMTLVIWPLAEWRGMLALAAQTTIAGTTYVAILLLFNVGGMQNRLVLRWAAMRR